MNARMPEIKACFEAAGFSRVRTLMSSGNVGFDSTRRVPAALQEVIESTMEKRIGKVFLTIVRPIGDIERLIEAEPFGKFRLPAGAKRMVTFFRNPLRKQPELPLDVDGSRILAAGRREIFSAYVPGPRGAKYLGLLERSFGKESTSRSWDTVRKCASI
jgi:uncharacterized protein (DUF1697 family)